MDSYFLFFLLVLPFLSFLLEREIGGGAFGRRFDRRDERHDSPGASFGNGAGRLLDTSEHSSPRIPPRLESGAVSSSRSLRIVAFMSRSRTP